MLKLLVNWDQPDYVTPGCHSCIEIYVGNAAWLLQLLGDAHDGDIALCMVQKLKDQML